MKAEVLTKLQALSPREIQIGDLIADEGLANKAIAYRLHLSEGTIKIYVSHIFKKSGAGNRTQLGIWVVKERQKH
jgi:two-component system, NarL family, nitrate/nitrite response regulator NarL